MSVKIVSAVVAVLLMLAYLLPLVLKLKEWTLAVVVLGGVVMMLVDLLQTLKQDDV